MKYRTSLYSNLYTSLPTLRAETNRIVGRLPRGTSVYLIDPHAQKEDDDVMVVGMSLLGDTVEESVPWSDLRHIELGRGVPKLTARCWRASREEMLNCVDAIREAREPEEFNFGADIDL